MYAESRHAIERWTPTTEKVQHDRNLPEFHEEGWESVSNDVVILSFFVLRGGGGTEEGRHVINLFS